MSRSGSLIASLGGLRVITGITKLTFACKFSTTEALPCLRPIFTTAIWEIQLGFLTSLCSPIHGASSAHVGVAHDDVKSLLFFARFKLTKSTSDQRKSYDLHCYAHKISMQTHLFD